MFTSQPGFAETSCIFWMQMFSIYISKHFQEWMIHIVVYAPVIWNKHLSSAIMFFSWRRVNKILNQEKKNVSVGMKRLRYLYFTLQNVKLKLPSFSWSPPGLMSGWHAVDFPLLLLMLQILSVSGTGNIIPVFHWAKMHKYLWCVSCKSLNIQIWQITYSS